MDIQVQNEDLLQKYFELIAKRLSWQEIFRQYQEEFHKMEIHKNAILHSDGSLEINNERIYSLR
ncbi:MAG: hypothetical protein GXO40_06775 [Epsilonproteobacteria bacterium]|nr:hypothetical protein [Campylobacterota bacterium]